MGTHRDNAILSKRQHPFHSYAFTKLHYYNAATYCCEIKCNRILSYHIQSYILWAEKQIKTNEPYHECR